MRRAVAALVLLAAATASAPAALAQPEPEVDPWGFEDELEADPWGFEDDLEEAETWGTLLRDQASDLLLFTAFAALALVSFFRKSVALKYVTLAAAIIYLGFTKSQLISVVNVYGLLAGNLPVFKYSLAWYLFAGFTLVTTVLWGRLYCGRVCAFGALTQLMDRIVPARLRVEVPAWLERRAALVKFGLLGAVAALLLPDLGHRGVPLRRAVLDVHAPGLDRHVGGSRRAARRHGLRPQPCTAASCARSARSWG